MIKVYCSVWLKSMCLRIQSHYNQAMTWLFNPIALCLILVSIQLPRKASSKIASRAKEQAAVATAKRNQSYALVSDDDQDITVAQPSPKVERTISLCSFKFKILLFKIGKYFCRKVAKKSVWMKFIPRGIICQIM